MTITKINSFDIHPRDTAAVRCRKSYHLAFDIIHEHTNISTAVNIKSSYLQVSTITNCYTF